MNKDDEFYTLYSDVATVFKAIHPYLKDKGYTILLPFDTKDSNFVKYLKQNAKNNKWVWYNTDDYESFIDYYKRDDVVVVSNPPFSIKKQILDTFKKYGTKFVLILPAILERSLFSYIHTTINLDIHWFYRPDKSKANVKTYLYSNFINFAHRVRYDGSCPHFAFNELYRRGNVYWDCFLKHDVEFSLSTWLSHMITVPEISRRTGKFTRLKLNSADSKRLYFYHKEIRERLAREGSKLSI